MSYKNLIGQSCTNKKELFCNLRDFLLKVNGSFNDYSTIGIGYTLWDASYAADSDNPQSDDYFVLKSTGEDGKILLYIRFLWTTYGVASKVYLSWDETAHAGSAASAGSTSYGINLSDTETDLKLFVFGDLDKIFACGHETTDSNTSALWVGRLDPPFDFQTGDIATCTSALTSGSDISITVDVIPSSWEVGREIYISTSHTTPVTTAKIEKTTIKTLVGLVITCDLTNAYTAESKLTDHHGIASTSGSQFGYIEVIIDGSGTGGLASNTSFDSNYAGSYSDPGAYENRHGLAYATLSSYSGVFGGLPNVVKIGEGDLESAISVLEESDGTMWRFFKCYSSRYHAVKEVDV